jgi:ERCC4-related helicase
MVLYILLNVPVKIHFNLFFLCQPHSGQESASYVYSHPKVEKLQDIVVDHFKSFQEKNIVTRAMIFCQVSS